MKKQIKNCIIHGDTEHVLYVSEKHQQWKCLKCQTAETFIKRSKFKLKALEYKGEKCEICGYDKNISALEFHHLDPEKKEFAVSIEGYKYSWEKNKQELDKCILVCSNCHRELHNPQQTKDNLLELIDLSEQQKELKKLQKGSICPICNTRFKKVTGKKYCSKECRNKAQQ